MAKELIISANVHEKKVAIIEDGAVTEFYVERRDENQGVVGNIYKGRVMKVLPGMQSAFVDIALERDAFLYVSDFTEFMEEEEEIDFRVMGEDGRAAAARPEEKQRKAERHRTEIAAAKTAAVPKGEQEAATPLPIEDVVEQLAEIADESIIPPPPPEEEIPTEETAAAEVEVTPVEEFIGERITDEPVEAAAEVPYKEVEEEGTTAEAIAETAATEEEKPRRGRARKKKGEAEEEKAAKSKKKSAKSEEETTPAKKSAGKSTKSTRRGSKKRGEKEAAEAGAEKELTEPRYERVTDEDMARAAAEAAELQDAGDLLKDAILQERFIEEVHDAEYQTASPPEPEPEWRVGSFRGGSAEGEEFQRVVDESNELQSLDVEEYTGDLRRGAPFREEESEVEPFRHASDFVPRELYDRIQTETVGEISEVGGVAASGEEPKGSEEEGAASAIEEDREAAVRESGGRAEFAVRRGGRGRRGRRPAAGAQREEAKPAAEAAEPADAEEQRRPDQQRRQDGQRRAESQRRPEAQARRPERGGPPTISELLHEGQEILVQIAKEPIAKKGARITSHIALPGRYLVYMPTVNHVGVSRKIPNEIERVRLKRIVTALREREGAAGGFIARTACAGHSEQELLDDMRYLLRTWADVRKKADRAKAPALVHRDLDLVQRILRDQLSEEFTAIRVDNDLEYARIVEFVNRVQPRLVNRVKLYTGNQPIFEKYGVQPEIDKAVRPRVWLKSGGYIVINQTEALVAIDVNTGKFVGKSDKLEDTITRTNLEAAKEIVRQIRLRDLGGIIVIDFIDMEERKNRTRVMTALQQELSHDRAPSKILSINDFGLVAITRKRVKQSLERTLCTPCPYCQGAGMVKSPQTVCFEILEQAKAISKQVTGSADVMLRVSPHVADALRATEREVLEEIEAYFGTPVTIEADPNLHQEQYDFAVV
ncbi:MAG TPA: Rne/Rng family ribonuclease [Blastocatellia bacterium]|nr:Rne/Rng family ribonuclease [Blastocatellia bacterium]